MGMPVEPQFHVLAVDDSLIDRKLVERLLKTSSYQVTTVDSGIKALEFLGWQEEQPSVSPDCQKEIEVNLIITDYCMPGMTGYDLLKKVKESSSLKNIPVVIMSSENVPSRITRCLEEGAEEFILKPVRLSDVNRLKPHMLRAKYGQQNQNMLEECQKPKPKPVDQLPPQLPTHQQEQASEQQIEDRRVKQHEQPQHQVEVHQQQNNKRKSMEDGLSQDRTRPRYNDLTTVV
ncbi:unnamed protein product [Amaranthus hypochondriacus]